MSYGATLPASKINSVSSRISPPPNEGSLCNPILEWQPPPCAASSFLNPREQSYLDTTRKGICNDSNDSNDRNSNSRQRAAAV